jgi:hypothetical protein
MNGTGGKVGRFTVVSPHRCVRGAGVLREVTAPPKFGIICMGKPRPHAHAGYPPGGKLAAEVSVGRCRPCPLRLRSRMVT